MDDSLLYERRARICQVLADPKRLRLIDALRDAERSVGQLAEALGASYPNISQHLNVMRDAGLVTSRREGTTIYYSLENEHVSQLVVDAVYNAEHAGPERCDVPLALEFAAAKDGIALGINRLL